MALDFSISQISAPLKILQLYMDFSRNPYKEHHLREAQLEQKISKVLHHAVSAIPQYKNYFDQSTIRTYQNNPKKLLEKFPILSKEALQRSPKNFIDSNHSTKQDTWVTTSGSSGQPLKLLMTPEANALEFNYYWRYWGWAGYTLGTRFAELSTLAFFEDNRKDFTYQRWCQRLLLNSSILSEQRVSQHWETLVDFQPKFIKGSPSALLVLSTYANKRLQSKIKFQGVFTTGEIVQTHQRDILEKTFQCPVIDSYGQMERVAAICQCPNGSYHLNSDYGFTELIPDKENLFRVISTSLYNSSMPLIRYDTGDLVEVEPNSSCQCGLTFPVIKRVIGRSCDTLLLPNGSHITAAYILLDEISGISFAQLVQDSKNHILLLLCPLQDPKEVLFASSLAKLKSLCGNEVKIDTKFVSPDELIRTSSRKVIPVVRRF